MTAELVEVTGIFCLLVAAGLIVGAASMVSVALAVLASGVFLLFIGVVLVLIAQRLPAPVPPEEPTT
jgi:hypothetical protein